MGPYMKWSDSISLYYEDSGGQFLTNSKKTKKKMIDMEPIRPQSAKICALELKGKDQGSHVGLREWKESIQDSAIQADKVIFGS